MARVKKLLKQVGGGIRKKYRVAKAGAQLAGKLARPSNQVEFLTNAARGKGFVLPGSKYIGPGNEMDKGAPVDQADANAYQHDIDYDNYLKKGHKARDVYTGYSDADERLLQNTSAETPNGFAVVAGMKFKKGLNKLGLTKRIRDTESPGDFKKVNNNKRASALSNIKTGLGNAMVGNVAVKPAARRESRGVASGIRSMQPKIAATGNPSGSGVQVRPTE